MQSCDIASQESINCQCYNHALPAGMRAAPPRRPWKKEKCVPPHLGEHRTPSSEVVIKADGSDWGSDKRWLGSSNAEFLREDIGILVLVSLCDDLIKIALVDPANERLRE